ncbi:hypothetical protein C8Q73DRAFT_795021 [Cubamyces lactineus]|nr:hypothetical protein C8Q73DRAFT_795021 [Cubamyces lactineus]
MHIRSFAVVVYALIALVAHHAMASITLPLAIPPVCGIESTTDVDHIVDAIIIADSDPSLLATGPLGSETLVRPIPAAPADNLNTTVLICSNISDEACEMPCTWYTGGPGSSIWAPNANCALATYDVEFRINANCEPVYPTTYAGCKDFLANGSCYVSRTNSFAHVASLKCVE